MQITFIISSLGAGGAERVVSQLANYFSKKNKNISIVTLASTNTGPFYKLDSNINLVKLGQDNASVGKKNLMRILLIFKRLLDLRKVLKKNRPDVIISFVDVTNITTLLASSFLNIPIIVSECNDSRFYKIPKFYDWLRSVLYKRVTFLTAQTKTVSSYFNNIPCKIKVIPTAISPPPRIKLEHVELVQTIVSLGRLCPNKGFDELIRAFSLLLEQYPDMNLIIYGEGAYRTELSNLIHSLGINHCVNLAGSIKEIYPALLKADLFVFPSHFEAMPYALCEAMSVGLPVIVSDIPGNMEIVSSDVDCKTFPVGDVRALYDAMKNLVPDKLKRIQLSKHASQITDRYSAEKIYGQWGDMLKQVIKL